ncbi:MAG: HAMP domain-containing sensor histidine kinase [Bacteroidota bacterium]
MKKRIIPDPVLMFITLLVITGFQVYWLRDNYYREKKALEIKTNGLFRETVRHVQDSVLKKKLSLVMKDTQALSFKNRDRRIGFFNRDNDDDIRTAKVASLLGQKVAEDSAKKSGKIKSGVFVTIRQQKNGDSAKLQRQYDFPSLRPEDIKVIVVDSNDHKHPEVRDSLKIETEFTKDRLMETDRGPGHRINTIYFNDEDGKQIIIKIDSLFKDSISVDQLSTEFAKVLSSEKLSVPFSISRSENDTVLQQEDEMMPRFPFNNFGGYSLTLTNTFPYLVNKITLPILFSLFLIGVTVLSFILLYRTLLKQQRLAVMKNEFISNITHELKTPIATVGVAIEALRNFGASQSPERTKEYLDISASELQRLGLLVDKVLKLSMFENKEVELKKETFDVRDLVNEVLNIMKLQFEKHRAAVSVKTEGDNFIIEADRLHIISVLYNLLDNALKYGSDNPVIEVQLTELPKDIIELKVSDNGIGIPKEYQPKIFDKFFRVPMGNQHNIKGYGLGLSYVSEIVRQHMGYIAVNSELGKGTTFTIKLPRKEADVVHFDDNRRIIKRAIKPGGS